MLRIRRNGNRQNSSMVAVTAMPVVLVMPIVLVMPAVPAVIVTDSNLHSGCDLREPSVANISGEVL